MHAIFDTLPHGAVLDAACGTGRHSVTLTQCGHRVVGVDRSAAMLAKARAKLPNADFREGGLTALPLDGASVDAAVCALALVHLPELDKAVAELARVVRLGGRVVIGDVHSFLLLLGWQAQFHLVEGGAGFMRVRTHPISAYSAAFANAGLRIRTFHEPLLRPQSAITVATDRYPEANHAAWVGLPGAVVWDLERTT